MRLSVIIPGYNTPKAWWKRCVDSVRRAVDPEDEIILVDDGSDGGAHFLDEWGCKVIHKPNGGLSDARNAALKTARGEYVTFVDSDDEIVGDVLRRCCARLDQLAYDVCLYGVKTIWVSDGLMKVDVPDLREYSVLTPSDVLSLSRQCLMNYACNKVYRRDFLLEKKIVFDLDGMPNEDIIFNLECVMNGAKWCIVDSIGYIYYRTGNTLLSRYKSSNTKGNVNVTLVWKKYKDATPGAREILGSYGEFSDGQLVLSDWGNLWRAGSPFGLLDRWKWLKVNRKRIATGSSGCWARLVKLSLPAFFIVQSLMWLVRRYLYIRPLRRWNIRRGCNNVVHWDGQI